MSSTPLLKPSLLTTAPRLLIIAPQRWDDACFAWPGIRALLEARHSQQTDIFCIDPQVAFWRDCPGLGAVTGWKNSASARHIAATLRQLEQPPHAAWLLEDNPASHACVAAKIPERIGLAEGALASLLTTGIKPPSREQAITHCVQDNMHLLQQFHLDPRRADFFAPLSLPVMSPEPRLLICPESDHGRHYEWNAPAWVALLSELEKIGMPQPLLIALAGSRSILTKQVAKALKLDVLTLDLEENSSLRHGLGHGHMLIGADSSLIHLAAHFGLTTIALFGPNSIPWRRALGRQHLQISQHVECSPCFQPRCHFDLRCQDQLTPNVVLSAIKRHLANTEQPRA